jgi:hypothetical protein
VRKFLPGLLLLAMSGCNKPVDESSLVKSGCPDRPQSSLEGKNVKQVSITNSSLRESGQVNAGKQTGFSFDAKKGQKFSYSTKDEVCVWTYDPSITLVNSDEIPIDGKYTVQVSALKGSTSFTLELALKDNSIAQSPAVSTPTNISKQKSTEDISSATTNRSDPEEFIKRHYSNLNGRNYDLTWKELSPDFQQISTGFSGYTDWWNSVERIELTSTKLVRRTDSQAIVDTELRYTMKTGSVSDDERGRIILEWNSGKASWELAKKTSR